MKAIIKNKESRDYYTVNKLDFYWESMVGHLGDSVELIKSESVGNKYKRLVFTVEVLDVDKFEEYIKAKRFETWSVERDYKLKKKKKKEKKKKTETIKTKNKKEKKKEYDVMANGEKQFKLF